MEQDPNVRKIASLSIRQKSLKLGPVGRLRTYSILNDILEPHIFCVEKQTNYILPLKRTRRPILPCNGWHNWIRDDDDNALEEGGDCVVDHPTQLICISDIYLLIWRWWPLWSGGTLFQWIFFFRISVSYTYCPWKIKNRTINWQNPWKKVLFPAPPTSWLSLAGYGQTISGYGQTKSGYGQSRTI